MHFKTSENFARKCTIFAQKISGEGYSPTPYPSPYSEFLDLPLLMRPEKPNLLSLHLCH